MNLLAFNKTVFAILVVFAISSNQVFADSTFMYQGELKANGNAANGTFPMVFSMWDTAALGTQIGTTVTQSVIVTEGRFSVELDFGVEAFGESGRWLEITVDGNTLEPRNRISRAPFSIQTRGLFVDASDRVGIGTTTPATDLDVVGTARAETLRASEAFVAGDGTSTLMNLINGGGGNQSNTALIVGSVNGSGRAASFYGNTSSTLFSVHNDGTGEAAKFMGRTTNVPAVMFDNLDNGPTIWAHGGDDVNGSEGGIIVVGDESAGNIGIDANEIMARNNGSPSTLLINREGGHVAIGSASGGSAILSTPVLQITGGSDFSEMFDVVGDVDIQPGMVVVIDPDHPGKLVPCSVCCDKKVAGIISGAGGVATGLTMGHDGTIANGKHPVALTGRVYCLVDSSAQKIEPGDMLTTSATPGHAMKATDVNAAAGAIIGKAMTSLDKGSTGLVLVLVNLQ